MADKKPKIFYGWIIVVAGFLATGASVGIYNNTLSVFVKPVCEALGFSRGQFTVYNSVMAVATMLIAPFYGEIFQKGNMKRVMLVCTLLMALVPWGYSFSTRLWQFYILAALQGILVSGISIMAIATLINNWFHEKKGTATGVAVAGSGITASLMVPVITQIIERMGWQWGYRAMSISATAILLPVIFFMIKIRPSDMGLVPYGAKADYVAGDSSETVGFTRGEAMRMPSFYLIVVAMVAACFAGGCMQAHAMSYYTDIGHSSAFASSMVSLAMLMLSFGKIGLGWVIDRFGMMVGGLSVAATIFAAAMFMGFAALPAFAVVAACCYGYGVACGSVAPSQVASRYFGSRDFSRVYAVISMVVSLSSIFSQPFPGFVYDLMGSYLTAWHIAAAIAALSVVFFALAERANRVAWNKLFERERLKSESENTAESLSEID